MYYRDYLSHKLALLAQGKEQRPSKPFVAGSNPAGGSMNSSALIK